MAHGEGEAAAAGSSPAPGPPGPVSFGFSRTAGRRRLAAEEEEEEEEEDFVRAVEGRAVRSVRPPEDAARELVIPVLRPGHGRRPAPSPAALPEDGVLRQAVEELVGEAQRAAQAQQQGAEAVPPVTVPPVAVPHGAHEAAGADYEAVPVEAYGLAMLRGMGWRPGEGIGRTFKQVVKPRENPLRPKGLGLGASLAAPPAAPRARAGSPEPGLAPGRAVLVLAGPHRGRSGHVQGLDPDNARALVRLAPDGAVATLSEHVLRPLPQDRGAPPEEKRPRPAPPGRAPGPHWLRRDLRVRCVDRRLLGGRYYKSKMTVEDVEGPGTCACRTDDGRLLEGLRERALETVVPRQERAAVMVVLGPHRGQLGRLLGRDPERSRALVQLLQAGAGADGEGGVLQLDYDAVCQYVGPGAED